MIDYQLVQPAKQLNSAFNVVLTGTNTSQATIYPSISLLGKIGSVPYYSGKGFGWNAATSDLTAKDPNTNYPLALVPRDPLNLNPPGGSNCDYTAPDNQDLLLGWEVPNANGGVSVPCPSLHRPDLIAYWQKNASNYQATFNANLLRQIMYRPIGANCGVANPDHPNFTGSNPNFNPMWDGVTPGKSAWDVDCDGDGFADSVWVDLGFPVAHTVHGRAYKPLFAILCVDLDGRLNLNAHGNLAQANANYGQSVSLPGGTLPGDTALPQGLMFAGGGSSVPFPRGQGYGPAEVNLSPLLGANNYLALLQGNGTLLGRYGGDGLAGTTANNGYTWLTWNRWFSYGENFWTNAQNGTPQDDWGSPPDPQSIGAAGLDPTGNPLYPSMGGSLKNTPYDLDLSHYAPHATGSMTPDSPFSVSEFEKIIRPFDRDGGSLPPRLAQLTAGALLPHRTEVTVESYAVDFAPGGGTRMNLNAPFDAGARAAGGGTQYVQYVNSTSGTKAVAFTPTTRQQYAQNLYNLMTSAANTKALGTRLGSAAAANQLIAQWAVNCVAYRDHSSIMPQFNSAGGTVYGCKRPGLIITESIAWHDRRTQDLNTETVNPQKPGGYNTGTGTYLPPLSGRTKPGYTTDSTPAQDPGFNQSFRPQDSLFIELYNPQSAAEAQYPRSAANGRATAVGRASRRLADADQRPGRRRHRRFAGLATDHHRSVEAGQRGGGQRHDAGPRCCDPDHRTRGLFRSQPDGHSQRCPRLLALERAQPGGGSPGSICRGRFGRADGPQHEADPHRPGHFTADRQPVRSVHRPLGKQQSSRAKHRRGGRGRRHCRPSWRSTARNA